MQGQGAVHVMSIDGGAAAPARVNGVPWQNALDAPDTHLVGGLGFENLVVVI